jgi:uncharacterized protein YcfL
MFYNVKGKRNWPKFAVVLLGLSALLLTGCQAEQEGTGNGSDQAVIESNANAVLEALKDQDMTALASYVHPQKGLRFTPYTYIDLENHLHFNADEIKGLLQNSTVYTWGTYEGSGEPINLTFAQYYDQFIYDQDFLTAPEVVYNEVLQRGSAINNITEAYPEGVSVEYHFPGFDEQYGGVDWESLKLVFEKDGTNWYLVGIIHEAWTP